MGKLMKDRYRREQEGRQEQETNAAVSAEEQVEQYTGESISTVRSAAGRGLDKAHRTIRQRQEAKANVGQVEPAPDGTEPAPLVIVPVPLDPEAPPGGELEAVEEAVAARPRRRREASGPPLGMLPRGLGS